MHIKKAVITAAGFGTRFLPITKSIEKEMLPVLNKPVIDYLVDDCIAGGITDFIIVVNKPSTQIEEYYSNKPAITKNLIAAGKSDIAADLHQLHTKARFTFVIQQPEVGYGTAVPLKVAQSHLENEDAFLVLMGDDFLYNGEQFSETGLLIERFRAAHSTNNAQGLVTCIERPDSELSKYGIAKIHQEKGLPYLTTLVEKPAPGTAPSNLANISKYIFTPKVFEKLPEQQPNPQSGEYYITDTATMLAASHPVVVYVPESEYLDCGKPESWLKANNTVAKKQAQALKN